MYQNMVRMYHIVVKARKTHRGPLIRSDETMTLKGGMKLAVHPGYETNSIFAVICDNYIVEEAGVSECLHKTEKRVFELLV
jgi:Xaa-Pro aminopeptidase